MELYHPYNGLTYKGLYDIRFGYESGKILALRNVHESGNFLRLRNVKNGKDSA
jgi:hypothetical protein